MIHVALVRLLCVVGLAMTALSQAASAEDHVLAYHINYVVPDAHSLTERLKQIDVVAVVRIARAGQPRVAELAAMARNQDVVPDVELPPVILTEHAADVVEVLKATTHPVAQGGGISLLQHGGEITWHSRLVRTHAKVPTLSPGATYLVFLNYNQASAGMMVSPFDVFRVDRGHVESSELSSTKYAASIVGLTSRDGLEIVRRAIGNRASD